MLLFHIVQEAKQFSHKMYKLVYKGQSGMGSNIGGTENKSVPYIDVTGECSSSPSALGLQVVFQSE